MDFSKVEYRCRGCGNVWEVKERDRIIAILPCEKCGMTSDRIARCPGVSFRGGGWSKTGYDKTKGYENE